MSEINKILSFKIYNKKIYNKLIETILCKESFYISTNEMNVLLNPLIVPIENSEEISIQLFETFELANEYRTNNPIYFSKIERNELLLLLDKLFFKGVTGVLYFSETEVVTSYLHIEDLLKDNHLVNKETKEIVKVLNELN